MSEERITGVTAAAYTIPTESPESDGTFEWDSTTLVIAEVETAANVAGFGYTYASPAAAIVIREHLARAVVGADAQQTQTAWQAMVHAVRNIGRPGIAAAAISAVDTAMWDLKAKLLGVPLFRLVGGSDGPIPIYGSGGFTSYSVVELQKQLAGWIDQGITRVKMKVGRNAADDITRVRAARAAIGASTELYVDANAGYSVKQALAQSRKFAESGVTWFEEPVIADDLAGLSFLRARMPPGMEMAGGEYGYSLADFKRILDAGAVHVLQADATRCCGISEFLRAGALSEAYGIPLSSHTAPTVHLHAASALGNFRHLEYFHDHVLIEKRFFDGVVEPRNGSLIPDAARPGLGVELKRRDIEPFRFV